MGLTISYKLSTREPWTSEGVCGRLEILSDYARHLGCVNVSPVIPASEQAEITDKLHTVGRGHARRYVPIRAAEGWVVVIDVGNGCQPLALGLCKYPSEWRCQHGHSWPRWHPTNISDEWQFSWFCKTQFSGKHGLAHFVRCHKSVISLLDFCRKAGLDVTVRDETGYWEQRGGTELIKVVRTSEALLAAFGGLLKDVAETRCGRKIASPIFDYANFEHLEHGGWERFGNRFELLRRCLMP
jgi:hypothetical protein